MAALDIANDIPASIDTVEKLVAWNGFLAEYLFRGDRVRLSSTDTRKPADWTSFVNSDGQLIYQFQQQIIVSDAALNTTSGKLWEFAQAINTLTIPVDYQS